MLKKKMIVVLFSQLLRVFRMDFQNKYRKQSLITQHFLFASYGFTWEFIPTVA